jgi:hypothetical protein
MTERKTITLRIDQLVIESDARLNGHALQRALGTALEAIIIERGVPEAWSHSLTLRSAVVSEAGWDGRGAEVGLARSLATQLYEGTLR